MSSNLRTVDVEAKFPFPNGSTAYRIVEEITQEHGIVYTAIDLHAARLLHQFARGTGTLLPSGDIDAAEIAQKKVLDLGCGSGQVFRGIDQMIDIHPDAAKRGEPWLCRILQRIGADVTGIDLSLPTDKFRLSRKVKARWQAGHILRVESGWKLAKRDLMEPNAIDRKTFPTGSFDIVFSRAFIGAMGRIGADDPRIENIFRKDPESYLMGLQKIHEQARRIIKPDGAFIISDQLFVPTPDNDFILTRDLGFELNEEDQPSEEERTLMLVEALGGEDIPLEELLELAIQILFEGQDMPPQEVQTTIRQNLLASLQTLIANKQITSRSDGATGLVFSKT